MNRRDYSPEADALFQSIADELGLQFERQTGELDVCMVFPVQPGLSVSLLLGLQNADELNLGIGPFWSHIFPFPQVQENFRKLAIGFVYGQSRVVEFRRFGMLYKRTLEAPAEGHWKTAYTEFVRLQLPIGRVDRTYILNTEARK